MLRIHCPHPRCPRVLEESPWGGDLHLGVQPPSPTPGLQAARRSVPSQSALREATFGPRFGYACFCKQSMRSSSGTMHSATTLRGGEGHSAPRSLPPSLLSSLQVSGIAPKPRARSLLSCIPAPQSRIKGKFCFVFLASTSRNFSKFHCYGAREIVQSAGHRPCVQVP